MYRLANARFAAAECEEAEGASPLGLVQNHLVALARRPLRSRLPLITVVAFWHTPWPYLRVFKVCPWSHEVLDGLLGSDIMEFQTREVFVQAVLEGLRDWAAQKKANDTERGPDDS